jgi:hypothetical protein
MMDAIIAFENGEGVGRDSVRTARRGADPDEVPRYRTFRKAYELNFQPADAPYAVSLVFRGDASDRTEILRTLRELIRRIDIGELNLEEQGRFLRVGTKDEKKSPPPKSAGG